MNKILVVDDDEGIRTTLQQILTQREFLVEILPDGGKVLETVKNSPPDLILLDLGLPIINGESLCKEIHKLYPDIPIIILTAKGSSQDAVNALSIGAVDFVRKPFDIDELMARVKVHLHEIETDILTSGTLSMNVKTMEVTRGGKIISLTPHEFRLLQYLLMNKGKVLTREMILNRVWEYKYDVDSRVVDVYIGYLRKKIDTSAKNSFITGVRGFGYSIKE